jgi:predicted transcriptional regulator
VKAAMTVELDDAVTAALVHIRTGSPDQVRAGLHEALAQVGTVPQEAVACVRAADEHLAYGELMEARTLLTVAHRLLTQPHLQPAPVLVPSQATPPTTPIRV